MPNSFPINVRRLPIVIPGLAIQAVGLILLCQNNILIRNTFALYPLDQLSKGVLLNKVIHYKLVLLNKVIHIFAYYLAYSCTRNFSSVQVIFASIF